MLYLCIKNLKMARTTDTYGKAPVVVVFKPTSRSKQIKIKVLKNYIIDFVLNDSNKIPGIPDTAEFLEVGVGKSLVKEYKIKYNK